MTFSTPNSVVLPLTFSLFVFVFFCFFFLFFLLLVYFMDISVIVSPISHTWIRIFCGLSAGWLALLTAFQSVCAWVCLFSNESEYFSLYVCLPACPFIRQRTHGYAAKHKNNLSRVAAVNSPSDNLEGCWWWRAVEAWLDYNTLVAAAVCNVVDRGCHGNQCNKGSPTRRKTFN